jgi:hypothetical protein
VSDPINGTKPESYNGRWWMLLGVWLLYLSFGLNIAALAPLVPVIESDLGMNHSTALDLLASHLRLKGLLRIIPNRYAVYSVYQTLVDRNPVRLTALPMS